MNLPRHEGVALRLVSWNVAGKPIWPLLEEVDADVGLLQEASLPIDAWPQQVVPDASGEWATAGWTGRSWQRRTAVVQVSGRCTVRPVPLTTVGLAGSGQVAISHTGALAVAEVVLGDEVVTVASLYAPWEYSRTGSIYADASAHRLLSDLSTLVHNRRSHRLIVAGDLNILHGYGEQGNDYWGDRYQTVFDRAEAIGLRLTGPQSPHGRQADPWPDELPSGSRDVPTYRTSRQTPATATRQLDFVFASPDLRDRLTVTAMNEPDLWGPSDHCRVVIDLA